MKILITGAAGFIGYHASKRFLDEGHTVIGIDNLNDYYSVQLKKDRLAQISSDKFTFHKIDIADFHLLEQIFQTEKFDIVINLAAQAGVRYSIENPHAYTQSNLVGFSNILELCRQHQIKHLVYASSSSVYGANKTIPFNEEHCVDHPVSYYAATKKANEVMAHSYASLYKLPCTGLRFFTVYGPWGRPDMAPMLFSHAITANKPINVFNDGNMWRDFTYIDDIIEGIYRVSQKPAAPDTEWVGEKPLTASSYAPYRIYNIGNNSSIKLMDFIKCLELELGTEALKNFMPMQAGDVCRTYADASRLIKEINYSPETNIQEGVSHFVKWFKKYYLK